MKRIRKDKFKESKPKARFYAKPFSGGNTNQLGYYEVPLLVDEKPGNVVIDIGSNVDHMEQVILQFLPF